ncbi:DUF397 domain-containing protein [Thermopolyspora sp. NPDC052614]|uniref:DUF397 domain-containing protein n=1 Tax=Thermopolyspora sp. NPDC052614 TaxID=3155682 RepID=UPI003416715B
MDLSHVIWHKSRHSGEGANCVEVAVTDAAQAGTERLYLVRDSKNPEGTVLAIAVAEWYAFIGSVKRGEFDGLG